MVHLGELEVCLGARFLFMANGDVRPFVARHCAWTRHGRRKARPSREGPRCPLILISGVSRFSR